MARRKDKESESGSTLHVPPPRSEGIRSTYPHGLPLSRLLPAPATWVFAGGGAHGAVQLGALQAMGETDARPDSVLGTSAGALTSAVLAEDPLVAVNRLSYIWANLGLGHVVTDGWWGLLRPTSLTKVALGDSSGERSSLEAIFTARAFEELALPMGAVATDVYSGEPVVLETGALVPALMASSAIPGVLPPVQIDGRWLMDGLASANLPASIAMRRGASSIVAFDTGVPTPKDPGTALSTVVPAINALLSSQQRISSLNAAARRVPVLYLPTPRGLSGALSFNDNLGVARQAYVLARDFLCDVVTAFDEGPLSAGLYSRADVWENASAPETLVEVPYLTAAPRSADAAETVTSAENREGSTSRA